MKAKFATILLTALLAAAASAPAQTAVVVDDGQRAVIENDGGGTASLVAVPAMQAGGSQRIVVEVENTPPPPPAPPVQRKAALVVQNHCVPLEGIPMMALTDALSAKLTKGPLRIVNPHNVIGLTQNTTAAGEMMPPESAVDLARELGAEGIVTASVSGFLESTFGRGPDLYQYSVRVALNLADAGSGAGICGATVKAQSPQYTAAEVEGSRQEYLIDLLHSAAAACAKKLLADPAIAAWEPEPVPEIPGYVALLRPGEPLSVSTMDFVVQKLLEDMRTSPVFRANYDAAQADAGRRPIAIVGGIADKTDEDLSGVLAAAGQGLRVALANSGLFDTKDDGMMVTFAERILATDTGPLEDSGLMDALKQHGSPDYYVEGDVQCFPDRAFRVYRTRLALHSLRTGKIVWEGIRNIRK
jgi:hypothetical protein